MKALLLQAQLRTRVLSSQGSALVADISFDDNANGNNDDDDDEATASRLLSLLQVLYTCPSHDYHTMLAIALNIHDVLRPDTHGPAYVYPAFGQHGGLLAIGQILAALQSGREGGQPEADVRDALARQALTILVDAITYSASNFSAFEHMLGWPSLVSSLTETVLPSELPRILALLVGLAIADIETGVAWWNAYESGANTPSGPWKGCVLVHPAAMEAAWHLLPRIPASVVFDTLAPILAELMASHPRHRIMLSRTSISTCLLEAWLAGQGGSWPIKLLRMLWHDGILHTTDMQQLSKFLLTTPSLDEADDVLTLLQDLLPTSSRPAYLTFESTCYKTSTEGMQIAALDRVFPPDDPTSTGFTLGLCLRVDHIQGEAQLPLVCLGAANVAMRIVLDTKTQSLVYEPGGMARGTFALPRSVLSLGDTHTVILTHARSAPNVLSPVHVYLDGQRVCTLQVPWAGAFAHPAPLRIGTCPLEKATQTAHATWSVTSIWLQAGVVPSSLPRLFHALLLASYTAPWQGALARYLTYSDRAALLAHLEHLAHVSSTPTAAYTALHTALFEAGARSCPLSEMYVYLHAAHIQRQSTRTVCINQTSTRAHAELYGVPTVCHPRSLGVSIWQAGGGTLLLTWIERATSSESVAMCVSLFVNTLSQSWRFADEAERMHAYSILGMLLREKSAYLTPSIFATLVQASMEEKRIINEALYRAVILDVGLWSQAPPSVQLAYAQHDIVPSDRKYTSLPLVRRWLWWAEGAQAVPIDTAASLVCAAMEVQWHPRSLQAFMQTLTCVMAQISPSLPMLGSAMYARTDVDLGTDPIECGRVYTPPSPTRPVPARSKALAQKYLTWMANAVACDASRAAMLAETIPPKWFLILLRPGMSRDDTAPLLSLVGHCMLASSSLMSAWTRLGGFRVLEASLPPLWDVPCVLPWVWTWLLGPCRPAASLYDTFAPPATRGEKTNSLTLSQPQALRVLVLCITAGIAAGASRPRSRRASLPTMLVQDTRWIALDHSIALLCVYASEPSIRALLMLAPTMVGVLRATLPRFVDRFCAPQAALWCDQLLDMLAQSMAHVLLSSPTLTLLHSMHAAMPTPDPLVQSRLCVAMYTALLEHLHASLRVQICTRPLLTMVAGLLELTSNESMRARTLQHRMYKMAEVLIQAPPALLTPHIRAQSTLALERNVLHSFGTSDASSALAFCAEGASLMLTPLADVGFVKCLAYHAYQAAPTSDHAVRCLRHMQSTWPDLPWVDVPVASIPTFFAEAWNEASQAQSQFLHSLARERVRAWTTQPSARARSILQVHARLQAWYTRVDESATQRTRHYAQDTHDDIACMRHIWTEAKHALRQYSSTDSWECALDATEGPWHIRLKLCDVPPFGWHATSRAEQTEAVVPGAVPIPHSEEDAMPLPPVIDVPSVTTSLPTSISMSGLEAVPPSEGSISSAVQNASVAPFSSASTNEEDYDKLRYIVRALEPGDEVQGLLNAARVVGIDVQSSLVLLGKHRMYLLDDYFQRPNGEIVHVWDAPVHERDVLLLAAGVGQVAASDEPIRSWAWPQLLMCAWRAWLHRRTALELFMDDGQSTLLVLPSHAHAARLYDIVRAHAPKAIAASDALQASVQDSTPAPSRLGVLRRTTPGEATQAWQARRMSNAAYLMHINTAAGRTMNDLTQFPIFPWVLADYTSSSLDLHAETSYRDLDKPMGAQTEARRAAFVERYEQLEQVHMDPFHYGTHYSTAASVCGFLVRLQPFARVLKVLHGGTFDLPDRLFASIGEAWTSASQRSQADVRELIPEFFFVPDMFVNHNHLDFGTTQAGVQVNHVVLPPWAHDDPVLFVQLHREALESDYVSAHLHRWIDLVFGVQTRGQAAVAATNVFHPMSYAHAMDLEGIDVPLERQAAAQAVHNFGQTPRQLFPRAHPSRSIFLCEPWHTQADWLATPQFLLPAYGPHAHVVDEPVRMIGGDLSHLYALPARHIFLRDQRCMLSYSAHTPTIHCIGEDGRCTSVLEHATQGAITAMLALGSYLWLGSDDGMLQLCHLSTIISNLTPSTALHGHTGAVLCLAASQALGVVVSGSADHTVIAWDMHRHKYVRTLTGPEQPVEHIAIDEQQGWISAVVGHSIWVWSINGTWLAHQSTRSVTSDPPSSIAMISREFHTGTLGVIATGHRGVVVLWDIVSNHTVRREPPRWRLSQRALLRRSDEGSGSITALYEASPRVLCTGDEHGYMYTWALPGASIAPPKEQERCVGACRRTLGFLDTKRLCQSCSGLVCQKCVRMQGPLRLCDTCATTLASRGLAL